MINLQKRVAQFKQVQMQLHRRMFAFAQSGKRVYCLLCSWSGRRYMENGFCPQCGSRPAHRLVPYSIYHFGLHYDRQALLHAGPNLNEVGFILNRFVPYPYYRFDIQPRRFINLPGDLCDIPLEENSVDHVLIWHVLEHIPDDRGAISEMYRVLKPGGKLLFSVPITPAGRTATYEDLSLTPDRYLEAYGHHDHVRACGLDYWERCAEVGFTVDALMVGEVEERERALFGLSPSHVVWCCTK